MTASTRRGLLGGAAALAAAPAGMPDDVVVPPVGDHRADAELIAVCATFDELERRYRAIVSADVPGSQKNIGADAERARLVEAQKPLVAIMIDRQAATREGQVARARSLILWAPELMGEEPGDTAECLTHAVLRNLLGEAWL